jgi:hypothetical protein
MFRTLIPAATFLAICVATLADAGAAESPRTTGATAPAAAPTVQVYSNPG